MSRYEIFNLIFIGLIFVVTTIYVIFAGLQWKTMQRQLAMTDRPWIKVNLEIAGPLKFIKSQEKTLIRTSARITIKNIGRSVATNIRTDFEIFIAAVMNRNYRFDELNFQNNLSKNLTIQEVHPLDEGDCVLPDDDRVWTKNLDYFIKESDFMNVNDFGGINEFKKITGHEFPSGYIYPLLIVGCVDYQFDTSPNHHQTRFIYRVIQTIPEGAKDIRTINNARAIKVDDEIPINELKLIPYAGAGRKAN